MGNAMNARAGFAYLRRFDRACGHCPKSKMQSDCRYESANDFSCGHRLIPAA